jgi:hypothetical protein
MISKKDCQEYLLKLIKNAIPKGSEALGQVIKDYMQFIVNNADNLSPDAQELIPSFKDIATKALDAYLEATPDTLEKRKLRRQLKTIKKNLPLVKSILSDLEKKTTIELPIISSTKDFFEKYCQTLLELLYEASEKTLKGIKSLAKLNLLFSCADELIISFHLAQHGFANQSYVHTRAVIEALDLIELFMKDNKYAEIWARGTMKEKLKVLKPSVVREKLGDKYDPLYSLFSEYGTHPTWDYTTVKSAISIQKSPKGNPLVRITIGGTKQTIHVLMSNVLCSMVLMQTLFITLKVYEEQFHKEDFSNMIDEFTKALSDYMFTHVIPIAKQANLNTSDLEEFLKKGIKQGEN